MKRLLLAALLGVAGCAAPDEEKRIPDNDPMAPWYSWDGPHRRGVSASVRDWNGPYGSVVPDPQPRRR